MTLIYPIAAAIVATVIEAIRIKSVHGEVININKLWTYTIGAVLFGVCLALSLSYYDYVTPVDVLWYAGYFASVRGFIYNPGLNLLRGLPFNYTSPTTNSKIDRLFRNFYLLQLLYLVVAIVTAFLWLKARQHF